MRFADKVCGDGRRLRSTLWIGRIMELAGIRQRRVDFLEEIEELLVRRLVGRTFVLVEGNALIVENHERNVLDRCNGRFGHVNKAEIVAYVDHCKVGSGELGCEILEVWHDNVTKLALIGVKHDKTKSTKSVFEHSARIGRCD
jgi:hypothetical protein